MNKRAQDRISHLDTVSCMAAYAGIRVIIVLCFSQPSKLTFSRA